MGVITYQTESGARGNEMTEVLLERLDSLLADTPSSAGYSNGLNDPEYTLQHEQFHQVCYQCATLSINM